MSIKLRHILTQIVVWLAGVLAMGSPAFAETYTVKDHVEFSATLNKAIAGDTIQLQRGRYEVLQILNREYQDPITITTADPSNKAVLAGLKISASSNVRIEGLIIDYRYADQDPLHKRIVDVQGSRNIEFIANEFDGDTASGTGIPENDGYATGIAIYVAQSHNVTVSRNTLAAFHRGGIFDTVSGLTISANNVSRMRSDGFNFANVQQVTIEGNHIHNFERARTSPDHADMLQFWTQGTSRPSSDIVIRDNFLDAGVGQETQSIFIGNEAVVHLGAGREMYFKNVLIEGNVIRNANVHGISVEAVENLKIKNNTLIQQKPSKDTRSGQVPHIIVSAQSIDVSITNNIVPRLQKELKAAHAGWSIRDNTVVQRTQPGVDNFYQNVFVDALASKSMKLADLALLPKSKQARNAAGSPLLLFDETPEEPAGLISAHGVTSNGLKQRLDIASLYSNSGLQQKSAIASVQWDFGDGSSGEGLAVQHHYAKRGSYVIGARVKLKSGDTLTLTRTIVAGGSEER